MKQQMKRLLAVVLTIALTIGIVPQMSPILATKQVYGASSISNPRKASDGTVTWDCVWFGSYPQSEVTNLTAAITGATYDDNGDAIVDGTKYRRIKKSDATYTGYHNWSGTCGDSNGYHYFKYESIKWRVLSVNGNDAFLLADVGLDDKKYNSAYTSITWENCTLRIFLNNQFLNSAFTSAEQGVIYNTTVVNDDNPYWGTEGGNNTTDKVYLLSLSEINNPAYGFDVNRNNYDPARRSKTSDYAHAMGAYNNTDNSYLGNCCWWLRSPGYNAYGATIVDGDGYASSHCISVHYGYLAVRPALHLNLSSSNLYSYAGTVRSDDAGYEQETSIVPETSAELEEYKINYDLIGGCFTEGYKEVETYTYEDEIVLPTAKDITRIGYEFTGWYDNPEFTGDKVTKISKGSAGDKTYYAKWKEVYTDNIKPTGSISSTNNVAETQTVTLGLSDNDGVAGYYWGTSSNYGRNTYTSTSAASVTKTITASGTYYLTVKDTSGNLSDTVSVTFYKTTLNAGSGSVTPSYVITKNGSNFTLPTPSRSGYTFVGWFSSSSAINGEWKSGESYTATGSTTLYAVWLKNPNQQTTLGTNYTTNISTAGEMIYYKFVPDTTATYSFTTTGNYDTVVYLYDSMMNQLASDDDGGNGRNCKLTYELVGGQTYYYGVKLYSSSDIGSFGSSIGKANYNVAYHANGGSGSMSSTSMAYGTVSSLSANSFSRSGYTFLGWADTAGAREAVYQDRQEVINLNATGTTKDLYAVWKANEYSITYNLNGGSFVTGYTPDEKYDYDNAAILPKEENVVRQGYQFAGWYNNHNLTGSSVTTIPANSTGDKTYYAKWLYIDSTKPTGSISSTNNVAETQTVTLGLSDNVEVAGYYWGTSSNYGSNTYTSTSVSSVTKMISESGTYYLTVKDTSGNLSNTVRITFYKTTLNAEGGSVTPSYVITESGNSFVLPSSSRDGYTFMGWNENRNPNDVLYKAGDSYSSNSNLRLYAIWKLKELPKSSDKNTDKIANANSPKTATTEKNNVFKNPRSTVIIKITKKRKSLKLRWKKTKGASGYQIQYATNKKFKKAKKVTVKGMNKTSKTIKKLKLKKKYYLRVRTYTVLNGKKVYSAWSKTKKKKMS